MYRGTKELTTKERTIVATVIVVIVLIIIIGAIAGGVRASRRRRALGYRDGLPSSTLVRRRRLRGAAAHNPTHRFRFAQLNELTPPLRYARTGRPSAN